MRSRSVSVYAANESEYIEKQHQLQEAYKKDCLRDSTQCISKININNSLDINNNDNLEIDNAEIILSKNSTGTTIKNELINKINNSDNAINKINSINEENNINNLNNISSINNKPLNTHISNASNIINYKEDLKNQPYNSSIKNLKNNDNEDDYDVFNDFNYNNSVIDRDRVDNKVIKDLNDNKDNKDNKDKKDIDDNYDGLSLNNNRKNNKRLSKITLSQNNSRTQSNASNYNTKSIEKKFENEFYNNNTTDLYGCLNNYEENVNNFDEEDEYGNMGSTKDHTIKTNNNISSSYNNINNNNLDKKVIDNNNNNNTNTRTSLSNYSDHSLSRKRKRTMYKGDMDDDDDDYNGLGNNSLNSLNNKPKSRSLEEESICEKEDKIKDEQYFIDNDQMLGRDAKAYTTNQILPKTEEELMEELEYFVQSINQGYKNNQAVEDCAELLCKYFKSTIINSSLVNNNTLSSIGESLNISNANSGIGVNSNSFGAPGNINNSSSSNNTNSNLFINTNNTNNNTNNNCNILHNSLFLHQMKYLDSKNLLNSRLNQYKPSRIRKIKNDDAEDLGLTRSLSLNSVSDINFKTVIDTILSLTNKNKNIKNKYKVPKNNNIKKLEVVNSKNNKETKINNNTTINDETEPANLNNYNNNKNTSSTVNNDNSNSNSNSNSETKNFKLDFLVKVNEVKDNDSLSDRKSNSSNNNSNNDGNSSYSNNNVGSWNNDDNINNISEIITENLQVSETIKIMLLGEYIPKRRFLKGLQLGEDLSEEDWENNSYAYDNKRSPSLEICKEKISFYERLIQLQMFDINTSFLNSELSKTYYKLSHSIVVIVDLESISSLETFFEIFQKTNEEGMISKLSVIAWKKNRSSRIFKSSSVFGSLSMTNKLSANSSTNILEKVINKNEDEKKIVSKSNNTVLLNKNSNNNDCSNNNSNTNTTVLNNIKSYTRSSFEALNSTNYSNTSLHSILKKEDQTKQNSNIINSKKIHDKKPKATNQRHTITFNIENLQDNYTANNILSNNLDNINITDSINDNNNNNKISLISTTIPQHQYKTNDLKKETSKKDSFEEINKKLDILVNKFKSYAQIFKIIVVYISHFSEISTENEIFRNFIGYMLLKKFNTPDVITNINNITKTGNFKKRNSITLGMGNSYTSNSSLFFQQKFLNKRKNSYK